MQKLKKVVWKMILILFGLLFLVVIAGVVFLNTSPEFGGTISIAEREKHERSLNFKDGVFVNLGGVSMSFGFSAFVKSLKGYLSKQPNAVPSKNIEVVYLDSSAVANYNGPTRLVWFGHSTFLMQTNGKHILIDPMFGNVPAPHPIFGGSRFSKELPISLAQLPRLDAVIFSHDHYDHLDYGSVVALKDKVDRFYTPLGLGAHLREWGIEAGRITELDWWDAVTMDELTFTCTPAQHFSGRGIMDKGKTLWSGWAISSRTENLFFSGDSGYGQHFKEIGVRLGPFDFAMMECGQYNELWKEIHMMPEETAQAGVAVNATAIMPIHWGSFKLAMHPWTEPVARLSKKAEELGLPIIVPRIGAPIYMNKLKPISNNWWEEVN